MLVCLKSAGQVANSTDPDQMLHSAASDLGLHCLLRLACLNNYVGWLGEVKVSCILHHWGIQLILVYNWARPAILAAGKDRGGMFLFLLFIFLSPLSFSFIFSTISSISSISLLKGWRVVKPQHTSISLLPFSGRWYKMTHRGWCVVKPQYNQSILIIMINTVPYV